LTNSEKNVAKPFEAKTRRERNGMDKYPYEVMDKLDSILKETDRIAWLFSKTPEKDFSRHRKLPFHRLAKVLIGMEGNSLSHEMLNCFHFSQDTPTVSALVQQRAKLLPEAMAFVFSQVVKAFPCRETIDGYRLVACDGSDLNYPANPLETDTFFQTDENARGYNLLHLNVLYDVCSKRYTDAILQPGRCADEIGAFVTMIDRFPADDKVIFTADRGYESYNVMAHIIEKGMRFLIRVKNPRSSGVLSCLRLPENTAFDMLFHIELTKKQTKQVKANPARYRFVPKTSRFDFCDLHHTYFYPLDFRVVAVELSPGYFEYLVTNLDASLFPPAKLKHLYRLRWGVESSFRDLKYTIGLSGFHSKRAEFIAQEVFARLILYNLCELVASHAALPKVSKSLVYQLNFSAAVHIFRRVFFLAPDESPTDVVSLIRSFLLPVRPNRSDPRKVKFRSALPFLYRIA
jgi:hypothetical protein